MPSRVQDFVQQRTQESSMGSLVMGSAIPEIEACNLQFCVSSPRAEMLHSVLMLVYVFHQSRFFGTSFAIYPIDVSIVSQPLDEIAPRSGINGILLRFFENPRTGSLVGFTYGRFSVTNCWKTKASKSQAVHNVVQSLFRPSSTESFSVLVTIDFFCISKTSSTLL
jgi:hypothetical protein